MGEYYRKGFGLKDTVKPMLQAAYASRVVDLLRARKHQISRHALTIKLAKEFGFCIGVERAVDIAYQTRHRYPDKRIFITNEIIHNASVNERLLDMGFIFLSGSYNKGQTYDDVNKEDVVILPAFGAAVKEIEILRSKNCILVDTTCGAVVNVWKSIEKYANDQYTSIIHGKYNHEETISTASRAGEHYLVVRDLAEAQYVCEYILSNGARDEFLRKFEKAMSPGFDPDRDLQRLGVANQTTMLSTESMEIATMLRGAFLKKYGPAETNRRFRICETICSATQDRQDAVNELMQSTPDVMIIIGGYNSSNTTHLAEISSHRCPSYHIDDADCLLSRTQIRHLPIGAKQEVIHENWWPTKSPLTIGVTAGASTPNNKIGDAVMRLFELSGTNINDLIEEFEKSGEAAAAAGDHPAGHDHDHD